MFVSIKKKTLITVALIIVTVVSLCLLLIPFSARAAAADVNKTVVIDAGHGGVDGGVQGINTGTKESDLNLAIARALKKELENNGYNVVMTRSGSDGLYGLSSKNRKQKDMAARKEIIAKANADLVISIHQNFYPRSQIRGAQVFYAPGSDVGKQMADSMQSAINTNLAACSRTAMPGDYYILQCSSVPSLLVECGFLSNPEDEKLLVDAAYQQKIAYTLMSAIGGILDVNSTRPDGV
ncbi:MAG: N-acetylmuramoyl-L-alanine amidase [Clostridia bacterium]|nr:N-acetylmuramoyl-L-alanine amidase [Clostridia bacterium]